MTASVQLMKNSANDGFTMEKRVHAAIRMWQCLSQNVMTGVSLFARVIVIVKSDPVTPTKL